MSITKRVILIVVSIAMILSLMACGGESASKDNETQGSQDISQEKNNADKSNVEDKDTNTDETIHITFWYSLGGKNMEKLESIIQDFNDKQDKIVIEGTFQGTYEESLNKLKVVGGTNESPTLMQVYDGGTLFMKNSDFFTPMQKFIDSENYDISILEPAILSYYRDYEGNLNSMPFNSSEPVMYYNKDMFKEAGLDPEKPPQTLAEIADYAKKLTIKEGNNTEVYGFTMMIHAWFFEQVMANSGELYVNNDNGRKEIATEAVFNNDKGLKFFEWLYDMYREGTATSYGRGWNEFRTAFLGEQVAMTFDSSANLAQAIANAPFEVGIAKMPVINDEEPQGCPIGGASVWIMNGPSDEEQQAAWEFIKYLVEPEVQADWHISTGYFPVNINAYELQNVKDNLEQFPQFSVPIDQVQNTKVSPATQGVLALNMEAIRNEVNTAFEAMFEDTIKPEEALAKAAEAVTQVLQKDLDMIK